MFLTVSIIANFLLFFLVFPAFVRSSASLRRALIRHIFIELQVYKF